MYKPPILRTAKDMKDAEIRVNSRLEDLKYYPEGSKDDPLYCYRLSFPSSEVGEDGHVAVTCGAAREWALEVLQKCDEIEKAFMMNDPLRRRYQNEF